MHIPVITIDGPSGSGKGTIGVALAKKLGWHYLDSGAVYRLLAWEAYRNKIIINNNAPWDQLAEAIPKNIQEISAHLRTEEIGKLASQIAVLPRVREVLLNYQRAFRQRPGLIADGRDMGSVVFPDADLKVFLTASAKSRAKRRYEQLMRQGVSVTLENLVKEVEERDQRDSTRAIAPLRSTEDSYSVDSTVLSIESTVEKIWQEIVTRGII